MRILKSRNVFVIGIFLTVVIVLLNSLLNFEPILETKLKENYSDAVLELEKTNDLDFVDDNYIINGNDAFYVYNIKESGCFSYIFLQFDKKVKKDARLQVFYKKNSENFNEEHSLIYNINEKQDRKNIILHVPRQEISSLRVDIMSDIGETANIMKIGLVKNSFKLFFDRVLMSDNLFLALALWCIIGLLMGISNEKIRSYVKKQKELIFLLSFVILCTILYNLIFNGERIIKDLNKNTGVLSLEPITTNDLTFNGEDYIINGSDAYYVYLLEKEEQIAYAVINFKNDLNNKARVQVFYAGANEGFLEENSIIVDMTNKIQSKSSLMVKLPKKNISSLRIDIMDEAGEMASIKNVNLVHFNGFLLVQVIFSVFNMVSLLGISLLTILLYFIYKNKRDRILEFYQQKPFFCFALSLFLIITLLYFKYLIGSYYHIFWNDIGSDSYFQTYPIYLNMADRIKMGLWGEKWSFSTGLGMEQSSVTIDINNWVTLFGRKNIAYLLGVSQCLKIFLAGIFCYKFTEEFNIRKETSWILSMGYAFSAPIIIRSSWETYGGLSVLLVIWLFAYEKMHRNKGRLLFPIATILLFYGLNVYNIILYFALLTGYIIFRVISENKIQVDTIKKLAANLILMWTFSLMASADTVINQLMIVLESNRFKSGKGAFLSILASENPFCDISEAATAFIRTVGINIAGIHGLKGGYNYLDAPAFYCGIIVALLVPLSLYNMEKKKRNWYLVASVVSILYILFKPLRYIMNGFSSFGYKLSSFWIIIIMILTVLPIIDSLIKGIKLKKGSKLLLNTTIVITLMALLLVFKFNFYVKLDALIYSTLFIIFYAFVLNILLSGKGIIKIGIGYVLMITVALEVSLLSYDTVNNRQVLNKNQLSAKQGYNDYTVEALSGIIDNGWYRVDKQYESVYLCDSIAQGYYDSKSYIGGSEIGSGVINFYDSFSLAKRDNHYFFGVGTSNYLDTLIGTKYILSHSNNIGNYGYEYCGNTRGGGVNVYKNKYSLPLAFGYDSVIMEQDFKELDYLDKHKIIMEACVVDNQVLNGKKFDIKGYTDNYVKMEEVTGRFEENGIYTLNETGKDDVLVIETDIVNDGVQFFGRLKYADINGEQYGYYVRFNSGQEKAVYEISAENVKKIWFEKGEQVQIKGIKVYRANREEYYKQYRTLIRSLQNNAMKVKNFDESYITGEIACKEKQMLFISIPYHSKWHIIVDGEEKEALQVNTGFLGTWIEPGNHDITIYYECNSWLYDNKFKIISFTIAVLSGIIISAMRKKVYKK